LTVQHGKTLKVLKFHALNT